MNHRHSHHSSWQLSQGDESEGKRRHLGRPHDPEDDAAGGTSDGRLQPEREEERENDKTLLQVAISNSDSYSNCLVCNVHSHYTGY